MQDTETKNTAAKVMINAHTHIFTSKHVPRRFTKRMKPAIISIFNLSFLLKAYRFCSPRINKDLRKRILAARRLWYNVLDIISYVWLDKVFQMIGGLFVWIFKIVAGVLRFDSIFSQESKEAIERIKNLARYANYTKQSQIFAFLKRYYDKSTQYVVLPMDLEFMDAGKPIEPYEQQIEELIKLKNNNPQILPFAFIDPRRNYEASAVDPILLHKKEGFKGFKLYPALGYYPFDVKLLDYLQYANDHNIPIMTHCTRGPVYYRGHKKSTWYAHPVFNKYGKETALQEDAEKLPLLNRKNNIYSSYFGHPLNYLVLFDPALLDHYLINIKHHKRYNFSKLRICLAHMGGEEEVEKYYRNLYTSFDGGIDYEKGKNSLTHNNRHQVWYSASWFRIISDLMKQYPDNIFTDISYTLNNPSLINLVRDIIRDKPFMDNLLFGTDFYMVAQERSEKEILHMYRGGLGEEMFDRISRVNIQRYLYGSQTQQAATTTSN